MHLHKTNLLKVLNGLLWACKKKKIHTLTIFRFFLSLSRFWAVSLWGPRRSTVRLQSQRPRSFLWEQHYIQMWAWIHFTWSFCPEVHDGWKESLGQPAAFLYWYVLCDSSPKRFAHLQTHKTYRHTVCLQHLKMFYNNNVKEGKVLYFPHMYQFIRRIISGWTIFQPMSYIRHIKGDKSQKWVHQSAFNNYIHCLSRTCL